MKMPQYLAALVVCSVVCWFGAGLPAVAVPPSYTPWELDSSGMNGAIKSLHHTRSTYAASNYSDANAGVLYVGGDDGGAYRSRDCGQTWDVV